MRISFVKTILFLGLIVSMAVVISGCGEKEESARQRLDQGKASQEATPESTNTPSQARPEPNKSRPDKSDQTAIPDSLREAARRTFESGNAYFIWLEDPSVGRLGDKMFFSTYIAANPSEKSPPPFSCTIAQELSAEEDAPTLPGGWKSPSGAKVYVHRNVATQVTPGDPNEWVVPSGSVQKILVMAGIGNFDLAKGSLSIFLADLSAMDAKTAKPISNVVTTP